VKQPSQNGTNPLCRGPGRHDALVGHQPSDTAACATSRMPETFTGLHAQYPGLIPAPCLKFRRHRTGTERRHAHSARSEFLAQRFAERQDLGLGGIIHRHPRARRLESPQANRVLRIPPRCRSQAVGNPRNDKSVNTRMLTAMMPELLCRIEFDRHSRTARTIPQSFQTNSTSTGSAANAAASLSHAIGLFGGRQ